MAEVGEAVCVDGLATRVQRPRGWANQKVQATALTTPLHAQDGAYSGAMLAEPPVAAQQPRHMCVQLQRLDHALGFAPSE